MSVLRWSWIPTTWVDVVQAAAWIALGFALLLYAARGLVSLSDRALALRVACLSLLSLVARLVVPAVPVNWYSGVHNVDLGGEIYSRPTTYMPLPNQFFTFTFGFEGIVAFNVAIGTLCAVLAWQVARRAGYGERVALLLGLGLAVTPMYVRLSASDSSHMIALLLWLLAAMSLQRLLAREGDWVDQLVLFTATVVACPVRIEAGLLMPAIIPFIARNREGLMRIWEDRGRCLPFAAGFIVCMACSVGAHYDSWLHRVGTFSPIFFTVQMLMRSVFLVNPQPLGWVPLIYVLLAWYYLRALYQRGDKQELLATVVPHALFSVPYAYTATGLMTDLPSAAYGVTITVFVLLAAAKGAALASERLEALYPDRALGFNIPAAAGIAAIAIATSVSPYKRTYAYMEELEFLSKSLPQYEAKVLAIWDPRSEGGDYDCCLSMPYPTLVGDFPNIEWQIVTADALETIDLESLDFDYYYPGSLVQVDVENLNSWFIGKWFGDSEMNAIQQQQLLRLRALDEKIRESHPLVELEWETLPARTFSWAPFRDLRMTLTLWCRSANTLAKHSNP